MNKRIWIALVGIALASCVGGDPYSQIAAGQAALQATQEARQERARAATVEAGRTSGQQTLEAQAALAVMAAAEGTQAAQTAMAEETRAAQTADAQGLEMQATAIALGALARDVTATGGAVAAQSTLDYETIVLVGKAKSTAISEQATATAEGMRRRVGRENMGYGIAFTAFSLLCLGITGIGLFFAWRLQAAAIDRYRVQTRILEMAAENQRRMEMAQRQLPEHTGQHEEQAGMVDEELTDFLVRVIETTGEGGVVIPRWNKMNIHPNKWSTATAKLEQADAVLKTPRQQTVVNSHRFRDVGEIYRAAVLGRL